MKVFLWLFSPFSRLACRIKEALYSRGLFKAHEAPLPVISIGNISFGGTGKTPLAMELVAFLGRGKWRPALISRGYKGTWEKKGGILSDGKKILGGWAEGGDEAFMAAAKYPTVGVFIGKRRLESCRKARELGFSIAVLDDAFQHRRLERDLDIVLFDPNEKRALREGVSSLKRADIILIKRPASSGLKNRLKTLFPETSVYEYATEAKGFIDLRTGAAATPDSFLSKRLLIFSGIANPHRFQILFEECGITNVFSLIFPDHYSYPLSALEKIRRRFENCGAEAIITTEKDAVKLRLAGTPLDGLPLFSVKIGLDIERTFYDAVEQRFGPAGPKKGNLE